MTVWSHDMDEKDERADQPPDAGVDRLERQMERASFFSHTSLSEQALRINEIESFLYGLIDTLEEQGIVKKADFTRRVAEVRQEIMNKREEVKVGVALRMDDAAGTPGPTDVNCAERIHICKGVCCKLNFALSAREVESGKIKWDMGQPYYIRHEKNGYCSHFNNAGKCCSIYGDRPRVCAVYSCANDKRIWKDFEKMELNQEWLDENLKEEKVHLRSIWMKG